MGQVRLGRLALRWCRSCNFPILDVRECPVCQKRNNAVKLTPPGDIRPGFPYDLLQIRKQIDIQFGEGAGFTLIPEGTLVVLNKVPYLDRMDEVIIDGEVKGALRYVIGKGWQFILRPVSAATLIAGQKGAWVKADKGAVPFILKSSNLLGPGVTGASEGIEKGDEVIIIDPRGNVIATGTSHRNTEELLSKAKGMAIKVRWKGLTEAPEQGPLRTWDEAVEANRPTLEVMIDDSVRFIKRTVEQKQLPLAVSFSGGKDSLASLHLVLDAGFKPVMLFANTGLEFPETVENVHINAKEFDLELVMEEAKDAFWSSVETFGPPGKDYRWCCKSCKLGPTAQAIEKRFPEGVLSIIGQRRYESEQRARKGRVWRNPWVSNQIGASPIQDWTALHVWLYLFMKKAKYNPLYERGLERIGCWLCPSQDLGEMLQAQKRHPEYPRWNEYLTRYAKENDLGDKWVEHAIWRWRTPPGSILEAVGLTREDIAGDHGKRLTLVSAEPNQSCDDVWTLEGVFDKELDMKRVADLFLVLGEAKIDETGAVMVGQVTIFPEGGVSVRGASAKDVKGSMHDAKRLVARAVECIGCGTCIPSCPNGAIYLDVQAWIDPDRCTHCGECLKSKCPVNDF